MASNTPLVLFGQETDIGGPERLDDLDGVVVGHSLDHQHFLVGMLLREEGLDRIGDRGLRIVGGGHDANFHDGLVTNSQLLDAASVNRGRQFVAPDK